jgi:hypothetical protein
MARTPTLTYDRGTLILHPLPQFWVHHRSASRNTRPKSGRNTVGFQVSCSTPNARQYLQSSSLGNRFTIPTTSMHSWSRKPVRIYIIPSNNLAATPSFYSSESPSLAAELQRLLVSIRREGSGVIALFECRDRHSLDLLGETAAATALIKAIRKLFILPVPNSNSLRYDVDKIRANNPSQKNFCPCVYSNVECGYG